VNFIEKIVEGNVIPYTSNINSGFKCVEYSTASWNEEE
jgi:hypothetical protein